MNREATRSLDRAKLAPEGIQRVSHSRRKCIGEGLDTSEFGNWGAECEPQFSPRPNAY